MPAKYVSNFFNSNNIGATNLALLEINYRFQEDLLDTKFLSLTPRLNVKQNQMSWPNEILLHVLTFFLKFVPFNSPKNHICDFIISCGNGRWWDDLHVRDCCKNHLGAIFSILIVVERN